jgi:putative transposase
VGKKTGKNPTDRGKLGVKRSVLTDRRGVPLGIAIAGANTHDQKLVAATLDSIPLPRPAARGRRKQHLCLDKGYVGQPVEQLVKRRGYQFHGPKRGADPKPRRKGQRARRWVVERTHSWTNKARRLLIRWEKKANNYLAFVHLQFAYVALKATEVLG